MNIKFLEAFVWVARLQSFKAAAEKLHATQAGISGRIATLEEQFGARLFERERRGVSLTFAGSELLPYAERMLSLEQEMMDRMRRSDGLAGTLRIGVVETVEQIFLSDLLITFSEQHPEVEIELVTGTTPFLREELLRGLLDCVIISEEIFQGFVESVPLGQLEMNWVASPKLAKSLPPGRVEFSLLCTLPVIAFHKESRLYRSIAQHTSANAVKKHCLSSLPAMVKLAIAGAGCSPLPHILIQQELATGALVRLEVEPPLAPLPLFACIRLDPVVPAAERLVGIAQQLFPTAGTAT